MAALVSGVRPLDFLLSQANFQRSRDNVVFLTGVIYQPGQVLGKVTASGKYKPVDSAAVDGSAVAVAVCCYPYDATAGDIKGVAITRQAEVKADGLIYPTGISAGNKTTAVAQLVAAGIIVR